MADNNQFNVADGSVAGVSPDGSLLALIKGYQENTWFFAPRAAVITRSPDNNHRPLYMVVRNRRRLPNGEGIETIGGVFACQLEMVCPLPTPQEQQRYSELIKLSSNISPTGNSFRFQPMRLRDGRMSIQGMDQYVLDPNKLKDIPIGSSASIPITFELNKLGADTFAAALSAPTGNGLPVTAFMQFKYDMVVPACKYEITADGAKTYDFFSVNVKARASYWGLVGAQADYQRTREELQSSGAIRIKQISAPQGLDDARIKQLETAIIDSWIKNILTKICEKPQSNPAEAPDPKGFFGGISVTMKSRTEVMNINLSATVEYSSIVEEIYSLSYVFGPLFSQGSPRDHLLDVNEDNKLPIVINLCKDERINRYTGQFGYKKQDGTFVANSVPDVHGSTGSVLTGNIQFAVGEPMPANTEIQLTVDWNNPDWEDRKEMHTLKNNESGAAFVFSPGNNIAKINLVTDLELADPGTISVINYKTQMPAFQGRPVKIYSGSVILVGQGSTAGKVRLEEIEFPFFSGNQLQSKLLWDVSITKPDGTTVRKNGETDVTTGGLPLLKSILFSTAAPGSASGINAIIESLLATSNVRPIKNAYYSTPTVSSPGAGAGSSSTQTVGTGYDSSIRFQ